MWRRCSARNEDDVRKEEGTGAAEHSFEDDDEDWLPSILNVDQVHEVQDTVPVVVDLTIPVGAEASYNVMASVLGQERGADF